MFKQIGNYFAKGKKYRDDFLCNYSRRWFVYFNLNYSLLLLFITKKLSSLSKKVFKVS